MSALVNTNGRLVSVVPDGHILASSLKTRLEILTSIVEWLILMSKTSSPIDEDGNDATDAGDGLKKETFLQVVHKTQQLQKIIGETLQQHEIHGAFVPTFVRIVQATRGVARSLDHFCPDSCLQRLAQQDCRDRGKFS
eukprot:3843860-Amphidinium_carterae.1